MRQLISLLLLLLPGSLLFAQQGKSYIKKGNELYQQKMYKEAEASYRKSVEKKDKTAEVKNGQVEGNFNLGDALFKQKKFDEAGGKFSQIAGSTTDKMVAAQAYHNLGNSLVENKKLEEGIAAYKKSLLKNPKDEETRYNLAYAQEMLKKQQQQNKNNKNQQNKDNKNQDKNNKDQNKDNKDKKDKDNKGKDKQNQGQNKNDQQGEQKPQPDKLSKDDAERMLDALNNQEKQTQDKLKNKKFKGVKARITKDW